MSGSRKNLGDVEAAAPSGNATHSKDSEPPAEATPAAELRRQIVSSLVPKNEREWWAHHEIQRLFEAIESIAGMYAPELDGGRTARETTLELHIGRMRSAALLALGRDPSGPKRPSGPLTHKPYA